MASRHTRRKTVDKITVDTLISKAKNAFNAGLDRVASFVAPNYATLVA